MPTLYAILWQKPLGNGRLFAKKQLLYTAGGGVFYTPTVDPSSISVEDMQSLVLFKDGRAASKFKYDMCDRMLDEKLQVRPQKGLAGSLDQLKIVPVEIEIKIL